MPRIFEGPQEYINITSFTKCCSEQNRKMNIFELFLNYTRKVFDIFNNDIIQRIYENFLEILGITEI